MKLARVGLFLLLLFVTHCLLADARDEQKGKSRRSKGRSQSKSRGRETHEKAEVQKQSRRKGFGPKEGKVVGKNKEECRWTLRGDEGGDRNLRLACKAGHDAYWCEFTGNPVACQKYASNEKTYWKQVIRALKKVDCSDPSSVLKASLCKKTKSAHMKMTRSSLLPAAAGEEKDSKESVPFATDGSEGPDINKIAAEHCSESWGSLCKFMLSAFQG
ncbi:fibroblast growth factor-binding protein 1-like [Hemitrygon akajei]|uniref:fibroblast growth factor-binding protein 1-like n=1 Tax=Hemitrygon akajei TaxID=2704970 RepID=UPI003BF96531